MGAYYIVTDLDVRARFEMGCLHSALKEAGLHGGFHGYCGIWRGGYSSSERCCWQPAEAIDELIGIIEDLPPNAREEWDACITRRFDIGFIGFQERFYSRWQVNASILRRAADLGANLVITIYRNDDPKSVTVPRTLYV